MIRSPLTWVEISKQNLIDNYLQFKRLAGENVALMAVVKANAYGHGIELVAKTLVKVGCAWFGVASIEEALQIRKIGIDVSILVLGRVPDDLLKTAVEKEISFAIYDIETLRNADEEAGLLGKKAKIHLKIETGTNRQGIRENELQVFCAEVKKLTNINVEGIYTHYANIEDTTDPAYALGQLAIFNRAIEVLSRLNIKTTFKHTACTAAAILYPQTMFDMVRLGIGTYGLWSSKQTLISAKERKIDLALKPVLSWKTKIIQIKEIKKGESVGYGRSWIAGRKTTIAVLPVGYWDGYDRKLSNNGRVLINNQYTPIVGKICMNLMMVDVTDIVKVNVGDEVVILGKQGNNEITAEEMADKIGTINYEVITRINPLIPRILI